MTSIFCDIHISTSKWPGSENNGVPQSEISAADFPPTALILYY